MNSMNRTGYAMSAGQPETSDVSLLPELLPDISSFCYLIDLAADNTNCRSLARQGGIQAFLTKCIEIIRT